MIRFLGICPFVDIQYCPVHCTIIQIRPLGYGAFGLLLLVRRGSLLSEYQISGIKKSLNFQCQPLPIAFVMDFLTVTLSGEFIPSTDSLTKFQDVGGGGVIIASILLLCGKANWGQERGGGGGGG